MTDEQRRPERKKRKLEKQGNGLKNYDIDITDRKKIVNVAPSLEEKKSEGERNKNEDQFYLEENSLVNSELSVEACQQACVSSHGVPRAKRLEADQILSSAGDSRPDASVSRSKRKRLRRRERKKEQERNALTDNCVDFRVTHAEVDTKCDATHVSEVVGSKLSSIEENSATSDTEKSALSCCNGVKGQQKEIDAKADATVSEIQNPKAKKRKRKRMKTMEVSDPLGNTLEVAEGNREGQSLLADSNKKVWENKDWKFGRGLACSDLANKEENSTSAEKSRDENLAKVTLMERKDEKDTVVHHDVLGLGVSHASEKKKKRNRKKKFMSRADNESTDAESEKETDVKITDESIGGMVGRSLTKDVSIPQKDEEGEVESLTRHIAQVCVAQEVFEETRKQLPRCICCGHVSKKLLILDLNGILVDVVHGYNTAFNPDGKISGRSGKKESLQIWPVMALECLRASFTPEGLDSMIQMVMKKFENRLLFLLDRNKCTITKFRTLENDEKPLVMKDLRKVWDRFGSCRSCRKRKYDETNTLLVDDSPYKALGNPPNTGVFPFPYNYTDREDSALGPNGDLRLYLERLVDAENVQKFVEENPFGQPAISESHPSWEFYSKVLQSQ